MGGEMEIKKKKVYFKIANSLNYFPSFAPLSSFFSVFVKVLGESQKKYN
jgi:hypothetical protein